MKPEAENSRAARKRKERPVLRLNRREATRSRYVATGQARFMRDRSYG